ncbi:hypothetical protein ABK040_008852 [Willaertia magna]
MSATNNNTPSNTSYAHSTQHNHWIYNKDTLNKIRNDSFNKLKEEIIQLQQNYEKKLTIEDLLTPEEEFLIIQKFSNLLLELCNRLLFPIHVKSTALSYLKRFYLKHSLMEYDIRNMMLTCIFLATKTEERYISLSQFIDKVNEITDAKESNLNNEMIYKYELILLQGLDFELMVYHPFRSLYAYVHDLHEIVDKNIVDELFENCKKLISELIKFTDVIFIYSPSIIAISCLYMVNQDITKKFISNKFKNQLDEIFNSIEEINQLFKKYSSIEKNKLKEAEKKLKKVKKILDPQLKDLENSLIKKQEEEQRMKREKKYLELERKAREERENLFQ